MSKWSGRGRRKALQFEFAGVSLPFSLPAGLSNSYSGTHHSSFMSQGAVSTGQMSSDAYEPDVLARVLEHAINWSALQENDDLLHVLDGELRVLESQLQGCPATPTAPVQGEHVPEDWQAGILQRLKRYLVQTVPTDWTVQRLNLDPGKAPVVVNARGVGAGAGVLLFGGVTQGQAKQMEVEHESSWLKKVNHGGGLVADVSQVYRQVKSDSSSQVVLLQHTKGQWRASEAREAAMPVGLSGHSAVVYNDRTYIFGGQMDATTTNYKDPTAQETAERPCTADIHIHRGSSTASSSASDAGSWGTIRAADAGGAGVAPLPRMHHSAAMDEVGGVMYVYGGVRLAHGGGRQVSADAQLGLLHAFKCHSCKWERVVTTGDWPRTTTLLAFFVHNAHLWAIPDVALQRGVAPAYQLHKVSLQTRMWEVVAVSGQPPSARTGACSVLLPGETGGQLLVYGGRARGGPAADSVLADVHLLDLEQLKWQRLQPRLLLSGSSSKDSRGGAAEASTSAAGSAAGAEGMLPLAGHACGAVGSAVVCYGGYGNAASKRPLTYLQVLSRTVRPIQLVGRQSASSGQAAALQHCRVRLARLIMKVDSQKVLLQPKGYENKRIPVPPLLLALHSEFFADPMLQEALFCDSSDTTTTTDSNTRDPAAKAAPPVLSERALGGAAPRAIEDTVRWMMGLKGVADLAPADLVELFRAADCLIMRPLMEEVRAALLAAQEGSGCRPGVACAAVQLGEVLPDQEQTQAVAERGKQALLDTLCRRNVSELMQRAQQHDYDWLKEACIQLVRTCWNKGDDLWLQLKFACRFQLLDMQGWALKRLARAKPDSSSVQLVDRAMEIATAHGAEASMRHFLTNDVFQEVEAAKDPSSLLGAALSTAHKHSLQPLKQKLMTYFAHVERWRALQASGRVPTLLQRFPWFVSAVQHAANGHGAMGNGLAPAGQQRPVLAPLRVGGLPVFNALP